MKTKVKGWKHNKSLEENVISQGIKPDLFLFIAS